MLSTRLQQPFVVENLPGDSGNVATGRVVSAQPDGQTLLLCGPVNTINTTLFPGLSFSFTRDLTAVAGLYGVPLVVEVHPDVPVTTASQLLAYARSRPGQLRVGYAGNGTPQHIGIELFRSMAGIDLTLVPYLGSAPALEDLLAGRLDLMFDPTPSSIGHIRAGRLRPLAVTGTRSIEMLPDVPPMADVVPGYEAGSWFGISAPHGTPRERIESLNAAANAALAEPATMLRLNQLGATPMTGTPSEFAAFVQKETEKYARVIAASRIALMPTPTGSR
jgi:tripartite-type tricarboxylate transporter receptor subunit TctC